MTAKKAGFKKPTKQTQQADDQRFSNADRVMQSGGYADKSANAGKASGRKTGKAEKATNAEKTYPTSWHATQSDRIRINRLQGQMMMQGYRPSKTEIMQLGLRVLENASEQEITRLYDAMTAEQASEG